MSKTVTARFFVDDILTRAYNPNHTMVTLRAAGRGEQNKAWAEATPSGTITMTVTNPHAAAFFKAHQGQDLAITFEAVDDACYVSEHSPVPNPEG